MVTAAPRTLTFDECLRLAQQNNDEFKIAQLDYDIAEAQFQAATGGFGPTVSINGAYSPGNKPTTIDIAQNTFFPGSPAASMAFSTTFPYSTRVSLSQPIFTFGKVFCGFKMAEEGLRIGGIKLRKAKEKLKADVVNNFYRALVMQENVKILEESLKRSEDMQRVTEDKYRAGEASSFDLLRAKIEVDNTRPNTRSARNGYELIMKSLKNIIGAGLDDDIALNGTLEYKKIPIEHSRIMQQFTNRNDDKEITEHAAAIAEYKKWLMVGQLFPNIALGANATFYSTNTTYHAEKEYWKNSWDITIGFQWQLFNGFKNAADIKQAAAEASKAAIAAQMAQKGLALQMDSILRGLDEYKEIIEAADKTIKQADEGYRIARQNYASGIIKSIDLRDAEVALMRAKLNYLNALYNYISKVQDLKNLTDEEQ
ncbi:MAG: TolC family protein [Spirochaetes bacterium]|nr:TolC family protein [Spirochaetota bacterium]